MSWDITDTDRYYHTEEGRLVAQMLSAELRRLHQDQGDWLAAARGDHLAVGYPFALLESQDLPPVFMIAETGVLSWRTPTGVIGACIDSLSWPCGSDVFDRVFIAHALEYVADKAGFLSEVGRCLKGEGEVVLVVPHRRSLWARADTTPFGQGTPFSSGQLRLVLEKAGFDQVTIKHSLHMPSAAIRLPLAVRRRLYAAGRFGWAMFGGVLVARAKKRLFSPHHQTDQPLRRKIRTFMVSQPAGAVSRLHRDKHACKAIKATGNG